MVLKLKVLGAGWMLFLLSAAGLAAASNLRLVDAAKNADREAVRSLLKQHVDVNASQPDGATALAWAAHWDDLEMADLLIGSGANVNAANDYGVTPLALACTNSSASMVEKLLKAGANPNAASWTGETAFMKCVSTGNVEAVKSLLTHEADVNAKETKQGLTPLMWAAAQKHPEITRLLIEHGADANSRTKGGFTPLMFAAQQGDLDSARLLVAGGAKVNVATGDGDTPLLVSTLSGHEELSIFLVDKGADPNAADRNGITALHFAMLHGIVRMTNMALDLTFAPYLYRPNMTELVKALLAHGANPNARLVSDTTHNESGPGYGKIIFVQGAGGAGRVNPAGSTPFLLAAATYDAGLMRILAAAGADPLMPTKENETPLMVAAGLPRQRNLDPLTESEERRALEAVKVAVELGDDVNAADDIGLTALHAAAFVGSNTIVQFLVEKGANINAKDKAGQTPLDVALNLQPPGVLIRNLIPVRENKSTADLFIKLGATPPNAPSARASDAAATAAQ